MGRTLTTNSNFASELEKLEELETEIGSLKEKIDGYLGDANAVSIDFSTWSDEVQNALQNYYNDVLCKMISDIETDLSSGGFIMLKTCLANVKTAVGECRQTKNNIVLTRKELQITEPKIQVPHKRKVANNPNWAPSYQGGQQGTPDYGTHEETYYTTEDNPDYLELQKALKAFEDELVTKVATANTAIAAMEAVEFGATEPPAPEESGAPDDAEDNATEPQVIDGGVIVDGMQYTTVPIGFNLRDGYVDPGDIVTYNGQVYTFGKKNGDKVILYTMDGTPVEVEATDLAQHGQYVSNYYANRGRPVDADSLPASESETTPSSTETPSYRNKSLDVFTREVYATPEDAIQQLVDAGWDPQDAAEEVQYQATHHGIIVEDMSSYDSPAPESSEPASSEPADTAPSYAASIPPGATQYGQNSGSDSHYYVADQNISNGSTTIPVSTYYDADNGHRVYINDKGQVAMCYQFPDGTIKVLFTNTDNRSLFSGGDGEKGSAAIFELMGACTDLAGESSSDLYSGDVIEGQLYTHLADSDATSEHTVGARGSWNSVEAILAGEEWPIP